MVARSFDSAEVSALGAFTPESLRRSMSHFATGVTIITTREFASDEVRGMTANAFMSVSLSPPLVLVSVAHKARCHGLLQSHGYYGVTILRAQSERIALRFAGVMPLEDEDEPSFSEISGVPILDGGLVSFAVKIIDEHPVGDHTLFIGEVLAMSEGETGQPLGFFRSSFARVELAPQESIRPLTLPSVWGASSEMWG